MFKVGDQVRWVCLYDNHPEWDGREGKIVKVNDNTGFGLQTSYDVVFDDDQEKEPETGWFVFRFKLIEEKQMFKPGDKVVRIKTNDYEDDHFEDGKEYTVAGFRDGTPDLYLVEKDMSYEVEKFKLSPTKEKQMHNVAYRLIGNDELVVVIDYGSPHVINSSNKNFNKVREFLDNNDNELNFFEVEELESLLSDKKAVETFLSGSDCLKIVDNTVYWKNEPLHMVLVDRILGLMSTGGNPNSLVNFLIKLQSNPSFRVREQLFKFLDVGKNIITNDGDFLAYKKVRDDFSDIHTGNYFNTPRSELRMPREKVDDDPNRTCSSGLHVCSYQYLNQFGTGTGNRVVCCKVNPADVVSVPADYNDTKMRTCGYEVLKEIPYETWMGNDVLAYTDKSWYDDDSEDNDDEWEPSDDYAELNGDDDWVSSSNC